MKKVLICRSEVLPQTQTFVMMQARSLTRYTPQFVGLAPAHPTIPLDGFASCLLTQDAFLRSRLRKAAYRLTGFSPSFQRRVRALGGDLIHVHFAEDAPIALPLALDLGVPMVVTLHGSIEATEDKYLLRSLRTIMYLMKRKDVWRRASAFICVSQFIYDMAVKAGYPRDKLIVHYIGVDTKVFRDDGKEERDSNLVLFVGRLEEKKGVQYLISAMSRVQKVLPDAKLVIIGDGSQRASLELQAERLGVISSFKGTVTPSAVAAYLKKARLFCAPSVRSRDGDVEGLPTVLAEAHASGLPVVSFVHGGIPEIVINGKTGLLAPEGDIDGLTAHLIAMLSESYPWKETSIRAIEWIKHNFDLGKQTSKLEDIYDQALAGPF